MSPAPIHWVSDPDTIECLASPARQRILDRLEALGPSSVGELADSLRLPPDRLYYHVRLLERHGLLEAAERRSTGGAPETVYALVASRWHLRYDLDDPRSVKALRKVTSGLLRQAARDFDQGLEHDAATTRGPRRNLWSLRLEARLSADDLAAINGHLESILAILRRPDPGPRGRLCALSWVLAPLAEA